MSNPHYGGNIQNEVLVETHDHDNRAQRVNVVAGGVGQATVNINGSATIFAVVNTSAAGDSVNNIGFATVAISNPTLYAVVNTGAVGVTNSIVTIANTPLSTQIVGNVTLSGPLPAGVNGIGFATVHLGTPTIFAVVNTGAAGVQNSMVTVNAGPNQIGSVTVSNTVPVTGTFWQATQPVSGNVGILGNITISPSVNSIGFATVHQGGTWTVTQASSARTITGNLTLSDSKAFIGLVSVSGFANPLAVTQSGTWDEVGINDSGNSITIDGNVGVLGNVTLSDSKTFVGLVTAVLSSTARSITGNLTVINAGTSKTLIPMPFGFALTSVATVAVPTNTFKITNILMSSNATVGVSIKSGATYLVGNASIRVELAPRGGWVENGSPDSPVYIGLAGAAAIVVEKNDVTSAVSGKVIYFDE